jgi:hypothetical protein
MRNITVTFEDGTTHVYQNAPDDVTPEAIQARAQQDFGKNVTALDGGRNAPSMRGTSGSFRPGASGEWDQPKPWKEVPREALSNVPSSAANLASGLWQAVSNPIDTATGVWDMAAGGLRNALPDKFVNTVEGGKPNPSAVRASQTADAVGQFYKQRYGSVEGLKNTLATDPVGAAADLSTVFAGGAAVAPKASMAARTLNKASQLTNPLNLAKVPMKAAAGVAKPIIGLSTGVGSENLSMAYKAGREGKGAFWKNLNDDVPRTQLLDDAKQALANMRAQRSSAYRQNIGQTTANPTPLKFNEIDNAIRASDDTLYVRSATSGKRMPKIGDSEMKPIQEAYDEIGKWRADPGLHTAEGLDALKQRLDAIYPESPKMNQAQRVITNLRNTVKDTIVKQSPEYAETMKAYETALDVEREITKALSLSDKVAQDTALRKLQSLARNNVNTNYGHRLDLGRILEEQGGVDLMPAIAGQAMNSWIGRGLPAQGASLATLGAYGATGLSNPAWLAALPFQSPKAMGASLYGAGSAARGLSELGLTPQGSALAGLLAAQAGMVNERQ